MAEVAKAMVLSASKPGPNPGSAIDACSHFMQTFQKFLIFDRRFYPVPVDGFQRFSNMLTSSLRTLI